MALLKPASPRPHGTSPPRRRAKATEVKAHVKALLRPEVKADPQQYASTAVCVSRFFW